MKTNRLGKFRITESHMRLNPELAMLVMSYCIPLRVEYRYDTQCFHYVARSEQFDELEEGLQPPEYTWIFGKGKAPRAELV